jgi:DNA invertase Pin-like site-specific DNA recombinase
VAADWAEDQAMSASALEINLPTGKCAIWARVSTVDQKEANQLPELRELAAARGLEVATEIITKDSAWQAGVGKANGKGAEFDSKRTALLEGARLGQYGTVLVWGIDRLSRRGAEDMLAFVRKLSDTGCKLISVKDPWVESLSDPMVREMLLGIFGTVARFESERRSERIKAGLARRRAEGKPVGRAKGATDHKPRRRSGYVAAWEDGGSRREAEARSKAPAATAA